MFNVAKLRPAANDPLPSQTQDDTQPLPVEVNGVEEYYVEEIIDKRIKRGRGRGGPLRKQYLVKWVGYRTPTWTDANELGETEALDRYEERQQTSSRAPAEEIDAPPPRTRRRGVM